MYVRFTLWILRRLHVSPQSHFVQTQFSSLNAGPLNPSFFDDDFTEAVRLMELELQVLDPEESPMSSPSSSASSSALEVLRDVEAMGPSVRSFDTLED